MSEAVVNVVAPGWFGKIPNLGDFVSRRLPWEFTSAWDDWLQQGMQASREALGARWLALYLSAPIWRFQVAPGVCGWTTSITPIIRNSSLGRRYSK